MSSVHPTNACNFCGKNEDLRLGCCFDCAVAGEGRAARRTVLQHVSKGLRNLWEGSSNYRYDFKWAYERLTKTGNYKKGGYFEKEGYL